MLLHACGTMFMYCSGGGVLPPDRGSDAASLEPLRGRESEEMLLHYGAATHMAGRLHALNASAMVCLARILLALVEGLGPELSRKREVNPDVSCPLSPHYTTPVRRVVPQPLLSNLHDTICTFPSRSWWQLYYCVFARSRSGVWRHGQACARSPTPLSPTCVSPSHDTSALLHRRCCHALC